MEYLVGCDVLLFTPCYKWKFTICSFVIVLLHVIQQVIPVKHSWGRHPCTRITWASFLGSEEPSLKLLHLAKLQRTNSSPISNCWRSKSAIFLSRDINYNMNSLLRLCVGMHVIYIYLYIGRVLHTGSRNENNIGAATGSPKKLFWTWDLRLNF